MKLNLEEIAKEVFKDKKLVIEHLSEDRIKVWYPAKGRGPNPFVFQRIVKFDEEFAEAVGMYLGDGKTTKNDLTHTAIATMDEDVGKFIFDFFRKRLLVKLDYFYLEVVYRDQYESHLKYKWANLLDVPTAKLHTTYSKRHRKDVLHMQIGGTILRKIFDRVIEICLPVVKENELLRRAFLRGHFAADGGIGVTKDVFRNYVVTVTFSYNPLNERWLRDFLIECLKMEGLRNIDYKEYWHKCYVQVANWYNYLILWKIRLFDRCERKKNKFLKAVRDMTVYLELKPRFRNHFFSSLHMQQWKIAEIVDSWQGNISKTIKGIHLLKVEQITSLLNYSPFTWQDILKNSNFMRIGTQTKLPVDNHFIKFVLSEKNHVRI